MKKNKIDTRPLSDIEWDTCWMAIRYAMNRQSISSASLPLNLVKSYWYRWTKHQKDQIIKDLQRNEEETIRLSDGKYKAFGDPEIDRPNWVKFWKALDETYHKTVTLKDGSIHKVFEFCGIMYILEKYIDNPYILCYVLEEDLKIDG